MVAVAAVSQIMSYLLSTEDNYWINDQMNGYVPIRLSLYLCPILNTSKVQKNFKEISKYLEIDIMYCT